MEEKILREILATVKENNDILRKLNLQRRWLTFYWFFKWFVIAALAYSAYMASKPYIDQAQQTYNQVQDGLNGLNNLNVQAKAVQNMDQKSFGEFLQAEIKKRIGQ